tara:strand:+ start:1160 stop:1666 length:507 start_codon:yes stop_codon:yes gene_type:complete
MEDTSIFNDNDVHKLLNPNIAMVGLNISGDIPGTFKNFHGKVGGAYKIRYAVKDTILSGSYMTDIIKNFPEKHSNQVMKYLKRNNVYLKENIFSFEEELKNIGAVDPIIFAFGGDTHKILDDALGEKYKIIKLIHYSHFISKEKYREHVLKKINSIKSIQLKEEIPLF